MKLNVLKRKRVDQALATKRDTRRILRFLVSDLAKVARLHAVQLKRENKALKRLEVITDEDQALYEFVPSPRDRTNFVQSLRAAVLQELEALESDEAELKKLRQRLCRRKTSGC